MAAELLDRGQRAVGRDSGIGQVGLQGVRAAAAGLDPGHHGAGSVVAVGIGDRNGRAAGGEDSRDACADAAAAAGRVRRLAGEFLWGRNMSTFAWSIQSVTDAQCALRSFSARHEML